MSLCRQNFAKASEDQINKQINTHLTSSYVYEALSAHFDRDDVALPGFRDYFKSHLDFHKDQAQKLINYQNKRGGRVVLAAIVEPPSDWKSPLAALEEALQLEKRINDSLFVLHKVASENGDAALSDLIEEEFLEKQVESLKKNADNVTNLKRVGEGLGVFIFDKHLKS
jgi:ferritin heavy chain